MARIFSAPIIGQSAASGAQVIDGSLKFDEDNNNYLKITPGSNGNRRTWTWSGWVKRNTFGSSLMSRFFMGGTTSVSTGNAVIAFYQDRLFWQIGSSTERITTNRLFRDTGWYHIVVALDTTLASDYGTSERVKIYVNGKQEHSFSTSGYPGQNLDSGVNSTQGMLLGAGRDSSGNEPDGPFDGQISNVYLIDGLQLGPGYFGFTDPLTGIWKPKKFRAKGTTVNDGRVFSSLGTFSNWDDDGNYPKTELFDGQTYAVGNATPNGASSDSSSEATFDFGDQQITGFQNLKVNIFLSSNQASATNVVSVNGVDITQDCHRAGNNQWTTVDLGSKFTTLKSFRIANNNIYVGGFFIDGVIMKDSTTTNLSFGTNGFYLPLDGNSPIGQDQSGQGNNLTPINFGGSVSLDNPQVSGAKPILNTLPGGTKASYGVFGSKENVGYAVTVFNDGGGNKYYIDGVQAPTLSNLVRGATYTFDTSDSSVSSHPFVFGTTANGNDFARGANYGSISAGSAGAATTITIPYDAPETLYYHCSSHSGMGGSIVGIRTDETKADQYASHVTLALPLVGSANDTSASIACTMTNKAVTVSGAAADSSESNFYSGSFVFDGSNDQLSYTAGSDFDFGGGDFTIETWINMDSISAGQAILEYSGQSSSSAPDGQWYFSTSSGWSWFHQSTNYASIAKAKVPTDKWIHLALVREGDVITHYLNGVCEASEAYTRTDAGSSSRALIIGQQNSSSYFDGHLQDYRIYKGVAKYSGTTVGTQYFVPASTNSDILPDTPSGVSGNSKLAKIDEGAVVFDGSTGIFDAGTSTDFELSDDHTIEAWIYSNDARDVICAYYYYTNGGSEQGWHFGFNGSNLRLNFRNANTNTQAVSETGSVVANRWYHVAVVTNGGSSQIYINGKASGAAVDIGTPTTTNVRFTVGGLVFASESSGYGNYFDGYISNLRIIKGTALYTKNFTPPPRTLTNVTNTKLLCCQSNTQPGAAVTAPNMGGVNDGTNWSHFVTGDIDDSFPAWRAFRNDTSSVGVRTKTAGGATIVWAPPKPIAFSSTFKIWAARDGTQSSTKFTVTHAGGLTDFTSSVVTDTTQTAVDLAALSGVTSPISRITVVSGGPNPRFSGIEVDSVMLVDPVSPRGNNPATTFNPFNTDIKTVRGQETGYATFNPLMNRGNNTLSDGNLFVTGGSNWNTTLCTGVIESGKWFVELTHKGRQSASDNDIQIGLFGLNDPEDGYPLASTKDLAAQSTGYVIVDAQAKWYNNGSNTDYGTTWSTPGDVVGVRYNADTGKLGFIINGVDQGDISTTLSTSQRWVVGISLRGGGAKAEINFGQKPFKFPPPDGFQPLNNANVRPETVIVRPDQYVGVTTYVGNGDPNSNTQTVRGLNFGDKPDLVWIKQRSSTAQNHALFDSIRGPGHNLSSSTNHAERSDHSGSTGDLMSFDVNGFTVGSSAASGARPVNLNGKDIVAWCWKAGGNKNTFNIDYVGYSTAGDANMGIGDLNSASYNTSNRWSDDYSGDTIDSSYPITQAFDGDRTTAARVSATQTAMSVDLTNITVADKIEVKGELGYITPYVSVTVGGVTHQIGGDPSILISGSAGTTSRVITGVSGALTNVTVGRVSSGRTYLSQILVDGKILVDDNITPPNLPSIANIGASVGTKQGFSIIQYQGGGNNVTTVSHGLLQSPQFMIIKNIDDADDWTCYHEGAGETNYLTLNSTAAATDGTMFNDITPTSTVFTLGAASGSDYHNRANRSGYDYISYLWHDVPGLQKFGSYVGNESTDGPYVELGFRPAVLIIKNADGDHANGANWFIFDGTRDPDNPVRLNLNPNDSSVEEDDTNGTLDFLSNGFKMRSSGTHPNGSGNTIIYAAWAAAPSVDLYGGGANAR